MPLSSLSHAIEPSLFVVGACLEKSREVAVEESITIALREITWTRHIFSSDLQLKNDAHPFLSRLVCLMLDGVAVVPKVVSECVQELDQLLAPQLASLLSVNRRVVEGLCLSPLGRDQSFNKLEPSNSTLLMECINKQCIGGIL